MTRRRPSRYGTIILLLAVVASLVAPLLLVQPALGQENATATPTATTTATSTATPSPTSTPAASSGGAGSSEYTVQELRRSGTRPADAPESVRYLPNRAGAVAIRYEPAQPFQSGMEFLPSNTMLHTDNIQFYSTRFGVDDTAEYTAHVVFWKPKTVTNNGTSRTVASDVREKTYDIRLGYGYDTADIELPSHYEDQWHATMWLTNDGEPIDGARWTFKHQTVQSEQAVSIDSRGDLWKWAGVNIFSILIPGLLGSAVAAKGIIKKTGRGPDKGAQWWALFVILPLVMVTATIGYFATAKVAARLPQLFGVFAVLVGFIAMLETMGRNRRTDEFVRDEIEDAQAPMGSSLKNVLYRDKARVYTVQRDDGLGLLKPGIRPFLARFFAAPAVIDTKELKTDIKVRHGPDDNVFIADADSDKPLDWTPAHFAFNWQLVEDGPGGIVSLPHRVRWKMLAAPALGAIAGLYAGRWLLDAGGGLAFAGAAVGFIAAAIEARDGHVDFQPAPVHYREARPTIAALQIAQKSSKTVRELFDENWQLRAALVTEMQQLQDGRSETVSEQLAREESGFDPFSKLDDALAVDPEPNQPDTTAETVTDVEGSENGEVEESGGFQFDTNGGGGGDDE